MTDYRAQAVNALNTCADPGTRGVIAALLHVASLLESTLGAAQPTRGDAPQGQVWRNAAVTRLKNQDANMHNPWLNVQAIHDWLAGQSFEVSREEVSVALWELCEAGVLRSNGSGIPAFAAVAKER
ncbi:hypothetical protein ACWFR1_40045 [Streptomyces sp. NPDC055103]